MSDAELFQFYKRTSLIEDLNFIIGTRLSPALRARAEAIRKPTKPDLIDIRDAWRTEREAADRAGIGNWHTADPAESEVA